jgi:hypothetical protein
MGPLHAQRGRHMDQITKSEDGYYLVDRPSSPSATGKLTRKWAGILIWALGLIGNIFHDEELREIRRAALRDQRRREQEKDEGMKS